MGLSLDQGEEETCIADENSNAKEIVLPELFHCKNCGLNAEFKADTANHVKVDREIMCKDTNTAFTCTFCGHLCETLDHIKSDHNEAKKPEDETDEFSHLIPEERAFLIRLKTMFQKNYYGAVPED
jgi:hypothetical protein